MSAGSLRPPTGKPVGGILVLAVYNCDDLACRVFPKPVVHVLHQLQKYFLDGIM